MLKMHFMVLIASRRCNMAVYVFFFWFLLALDCIMLLLHFSSK